MNYSLVPLLHSYELFTSPVVPLLHSYELFTSPVVPLLHSYELFTSPVVPLLHSYELFTRPVVPLLQGHSNQMSTLFTIYFRCTDIVKYYLIVPLKKGHHSIRPLFHYCRGGLNRGGATVLIICLCYGNSCSHNPVLVYSFRTYILTRITQ
jgi:hypothetical protein